MNSTIASMSTIHAPQVARLAGQLGYPSTAKAMELRMKSILPKQDQLLLVAEDKDNPSKILGWVHAKVVDSLEADAVVEISALVVDEESRGRKIGEQLVQSVEDWAKDKARQVTLRSQTKRVDAHRFYQRLGYGITKISYAFSKSLAP